MKKMTNEQLNMIVVCPICKEKRKQGEMMCGTSKPICKYCYKEDKNDGKTYNGGGKLLSECY